VGVIYFFPGSSYATVGKMESARAGVVAQVVECLPRKHKTLSSKTSTIKKKSAATNTHTFWYSLIDVK
jgi:hypothetical protein